MYANLLTRAPTCHHQLHVLATFLFYSDLPGCSQFPRSGIHRENRTREENPLLSAAPIPVPHSPAAVAGNNNHHHRAHPFGSSARDTGRVAAVAPFYQQEQPVEAMAASHVRLVLSTKIYAISTRLCDASSRLIAQ